MKRLLASPRLRLVLALAFLAAATVVATVADVPSAGEIRSWIDSSGLAAPLLFVFLYLVLAVLLFPGSVLTAAGGALFGVAAGTVLSVIGATAGATAAFFIARRLGRQTLERAAGRRVRILDAWLGRRGFTAERRSATSPAPSPSPRWAAHSTTRCRPSSRPPWASYRC